MMLPDRKAFYWRQKQEWFTTNENGEDVLTDAAPEIARKSFERYQLFMKITCDDEDRLLDGEVTPAYQAYRDFILKTEGVDILADEEEEKWEGEDKPIIPFTIDDDEDDFED
ncbi:hypothetical protein [Alloscardovia macacae]|uniref:Uncharacterized protein n=1 Tax=Alloscardovia macacae TaxID=1160091 RepID=A0A261F1W8_9BIFI|nr:hypothetical protein [Alloscardovia macacae]OZG53091.1 hypothetical protein ALMA_1393 [Alloscardovia macacae]